MHGGALPAGLWRLVAAALAPLAPFWLARRARRGKEDPARLAERQGFGADRRPGRLVWLHGASVGEAMSLLPLLVALAARDPRLRLLVTTGTVTSARLLAERLPADLAGRVDHRFLPLDAPAWVARFLDGWRPDAAVFVESELWPNLLGAAVARGIPLGLVNARLSRKAAAGWARAPGFAARVLGGFRLITAQTADDAARLRGLGAGRVETWGNLKAAAAPLPAQPAELTRLRAALSGRPVLVAASTHAGEEALILPLLPGLAAAAPGLLALIVPRHPERGAEVAALAGGAPRRSQGQEPAPGDAVWVADTLGELGLWFRLADAAVIGASFLAPGGHNPLEAARLGCPVLFGPNMASFPEITDALLAAGGAVQVPDAAALAPALADVLSNRDKAGALAAAAHRIADDAAGLPDRLAETILGWLPATTEAGS